MWTFFFMPFVLSMVNAWLSSFSQYFRNFENDVLGYSFWWIPLWNSRKSKRSRSQKIEPARGRRKNSRSQRRKSPRNRRKGSRSQRRLWEGSHYVQNEERSKPDILRVNSLSVMLDKGFMYLTLFAHIFEGNQILKNEYPVEIFWSMEKTMKVMYLPLIIQMA